MTNSKYTKELAIKLYDLEDWSVTIQYPSLPKVINSYAPIKNPDTYFIFIWRLVTFVRELDRIIDLANELKFTLLIMWDGPDRTTLQDRAWSTITFLGNRIGHEKYELLRHAKWLINLTKESCGIVTMEALALWIPVFGYNAWGTAELVEHWKTGRLVNSKDHQTLLEEFEKFQQIDFERKAIIIQSLEQSCTQE